jgi:hypothetical protein
LAQYTLPGSTEGQSHTHATASSYCAASKAHLLVDEARHLQDIWTLPQQTSLSATVLNLGYAAGPEKCIQTMLKVPYDAITKPEYRVILALLILNKNLSQLRCYYAGTGRNTRHISHPLYVETESQIPILTQIQATSVFFFNVLFTDGVNC